MRKFFPFAISILACVGVSFGAQRWSGPVTITDLIVWDYPTPGNQNYVNVRITPYFNPEGCTDTQGYQLITTSDPKYFERIYAFLLTAYTTGQKVSLMIDGCNPKALIKAVSFNQPQN